MSLLKFSQALIFTLASTLSLTSHAALNKNEREIVKQVEHNMPQALKEIEQAVNINSGSLNIEGVKKVGALASEQLKAIGFEVEWLDGSAFNRAGHVLAAHKSVVVASSHTVTSTPTTAATSTSSIGRGSQISRLSPGLTPPASSRPRKPDSKSRVNAVLISADRCRQPTQSARHCARFSAP